MVPFLPITSQLDEQDLDWPGRATWPQSSRWEVGALGKGLRCEAPCAALRKLKRGRLGHFGYETCKCTEASCTEELLLRKVRIQLKDQGCQTREVRLGTSGSPVTLQNQTEERTCRTLLLQQLEQQS